MNAPIRPDQSPLGSDVLMPDLGTPIARYRRPTGLNTRGHRPGDISLMGLSRPAVGRLCHPFGEAGGAAVRVKPAGMGVVTGPMRDTMPSAVVGSSFA